MSRFEYTRLVRVIAVLAYFKSATVKSELAFLLWAALMGLLVHFFSK